jgi:uncharacterized membrane protein (DUF2068 family)
VGKGAAAVGENRVVSRKRTTQPVWQRRNSSMKTSQTRVVRLIAVFKLLKAVLLIALGGAALKLLHTDIASVVERWVAVSGLDQNSRFVGRALSAAAAFTPDRVRDLIVGSFLYGGLFFTEGIGLWLLKDWAMWFTVILTGSLLPVEGYEIVRHPSVGKVLLMVANLALVVYLIRRIRDERAG